MRKREDFENSLNEMIQEFGIDQHQPDLSNTTTTETVSEHTPKTAKLNILLSGEDAGIQLANRLADQLNIPFVFINSNGMNHATAEALITIPEKYLNSSSQEALNTLSKSLLEPIEKTETTPDVEHNRSRPVEDALFIKDNFNYIKVLFDDIDFVKSDGNYIEIHWANRVSVLKKTMKSFEEKASDHFFFQVHRSYLINLNKITRIGSAHVYLGEHKIPLSKGKKEQLIEMLDTF